MTGLASFSQTRDRSLTPPLPAWTCPWPFRRMSRRVNCAISAYCRRRPIRFARDLARPWPESFLMFRLLDSEFSESVVPPRCFASRTKSRGEKKYIKFFVSVENSTEKLR